MADKKLFTMYLYEEDINNIDELKKMYQDAYGLTIRDTSQLIRMLIKQDLDSMVSFSKKKNLRHHG